MLALLGPEITSFPLSETAFIEALRLRAEQERTRQEQYRFEIAARNLQVVQLAVQNDVPPHLIPSMCVGIPPDASSVPPQPRPKVSADFSKSPFLAPSSRDHDNASTVAPLNYRFGGGPAPPVRRPLSPAKIGAQAVANLANPVTPYRPSYKTIPAHQRHFSMPVETALKPERINTKTRAPQHQLQSPLGATSSIHARPSPAQPLHKQTKSNQPPSQESMTLFQHIIQFHHWKPETPGERPPPELQRPAPGGSMSSASLRDLYSHKRHKSNDMSIDLLLAVQQETFYGRPRISVTDTAPQMKRETQEDLSMDTSDITITEPAKEADTNSETSQALNLGRYPHDILLTN